MSVEATGQEGQASLWLLVAAKLSDFAGNLCVIVCLGLRVHNLAPECLRKSYSYKDESSMSR